MTATPARFDSARVAVTVDNAIIAFAQLAVAFHQSKAAQYGAVTAAALCLPNRHGLPDGQYLKEAKELAKRWEDPQQHLLDFLPARLHSRALAIPPA